MLGILYYVSLLCGRVVPLITKYYYHYQTKDQNNSLCRDEVPVNVFDDLNNRLLKPQYAILESTGGPLLC